MVPTVRGRTRRGGAPDAPGTPGAMRTNQLTDDTLRTLSEVEAAEPVVVSLFLNLDPAQFALPPARASQITSLLSDLDAAIARRGALPRREAVARRRTGSGSRASSATTTSTSTAPARSPCTRPTRSTSSRRSSCPSPWTRTSRSASGPALEPVMGAQDEGDWCVLLVTRDTRAGLPRRPDGAARGP